MLFYTKCGLYKICLLSPNVLFQSKWEMTNIYAIWRVDTDDKSAIHAGNMIYNSQHEGGLCAILVPTKLLSIAQNVSFASSTAPLACCQPPASSESPFHTFYRVRLKTLPTKISLFSE